MWADDLLDKATLVMKSVNIYYALMLYLISQTY